MRKSHKSKKFPSKKDANQVKRLTPKPTKENDAAYNKKEDSINKRSLDITENSKTESKIFTQKKIAIAGLIISAIGVFYLIKQTNSADENFKNLNFARISVTKIEFLTTKLISRNEFHNIDWGYNAEPITDPREDDPNLKNVKVINTIAAFNRKTREEVLNTFCITIPEMLKLLNIPLSDTTYYLMKKYIVVINFKNSGQTICSLDSILVRDNTLDKKDDTGSHRLKGDLIIMDPNQTYNSNFELKLNIAKQLPDSFNFKCDFFCKNVNKESFIKTTRVKYFNHNFFTSDEESN
ncbi:MAG TPA: hypothetical protein VGP55_10660 [Chitinophagaceae bacterium]|nr:hypothetical protein [Chitinophagaceae bacterium]